MLVRKTYSAKDPKSMTLLLAFFTKIDYESLPSFAIERDILGYSTLLP